MGGRRKVEGVAVASPGVDGLEHVLLRNPFISLALVPQRNIKEGVKLVVGALLIRGQREK